MASLTIHRVMFTESDCYKAGARMKPAGVQVHSTGANNPNLRRYVQPDDGLLGENPNGNSHNSPGVDVCANAYIGKLADGSAAVYQTLPWDMRCWLSGKGPNGNANKLGFIGFEICEDDKQNAEYFHGVMDLAAKLTAFLCAEYHLTWYDVQDHAELHTAGLASDHGDITHWLKLYGKNMDDFRALVALYMDEGVNVTYMDNEEPLYRAIVWADNGYPVKMRREPDQNSAVIDKIAVGTEVEVLDVLEGWSLIRHDGITGYMMSEFLKEPGTGTVTVKTDELLKIRDTMLSALAQIGELIGRGN